MTSTSESTPDDGVSANKTAESERPTGDWTPPQVRRLATSSAELSSLNTTDAEVLS